MKPLLTGGCGFIGSAVLHLAAESHVDRPIDGPAPFIISNVVGSFTLLEAAREYWAGLATAARQSFRFHHVSTDEVFGALAPGDAPFTDPTPDDPRSPYSASKAACEHLVRAWLFIENHADAWLLVLQRGVLGSTYATGGRQPRTNLEVVRAICSALDARLPGRAPRADKIRFFSDRPGHDLDTGLARTTDWYVANRSRRKGSSAARYGGERPGTTTAKNAA